MIFFRPITVEAQEVGDFNYFNLLGFLTFIVLLIGLTYLFFRGRQSPRIKETTNILQEQIPREPAHVKSETIISKKDADHLFSMKKSEWEEFKFKYVFPDGWEARFVEFDTGSSIMAFDKKNNIGGLSVQPLYEDTNSLPDIVIVGSYYEKGRLNIDKSFIEDIKKETEKDLGSKYKVMVKYVNLTDNYEGVEITIFLSN